MRIMPSKKTRSADDYGSPRTGDSLIRKLALMNPNKTTELLPLGWAEKESTEQPWYAQPCP